MRLKILQQYFSKWKHFWRLNSNMHTVLLKPARTRGVSLLMIFPSIHVKETCPLLLPVPIQQCHRRARSNTILTPLCHLARVLRGDYSVSAAVPTQRNRPEADKKRYLFQVFREWLYFIFHPPFLQQPRSDTRLLSERLCCSARS